MKRQTTNVILLAIVLGLLAMLLPLAGGCTKDQLTQAKAANDKALVATTTVDAIAPTLPLSEKDKAKVAEATAKARPWLELIDAILKSGALEAPATQPAE